MRVGVSTPKGQRNQLFWSSEASPTRARGVGSRWRIQLEEITTALVVNSEKWNACDAIQEQQPRDKLGL